MDTRAVRKRYIGNVVMLTLILAAFCVATVAPVATARAQEAAVPAGAVKAEGMVQTAATRWDLCVAIAVAIGLPCLAAGYAVGRVGAAALGAASEKPELLTRSLLFVALAEGIAIYGLLVAVLLYRKL